MATRRTVILFLSLAVFSSVVSAAWWNEDPYSKQNTIDTALISFSVSPAPKEDLYLYGVTSLCYHCLYPLLNVFDRTALAPTNQTVWTAFDFQFEVRNASNYTFLAFTYDFGEHGYYNVRLNVQSDGSLTYDLVTIDSPDDPYVAIYAWLGGLLGVWALWFVGLYIWNRRKRGDGVTVHNEKLGSTTPAAGPPASVKPTSSGRVHSLDTFRGSALCVMIFVNYGGGSYWFFNHSTWNGLTVADLVFPWFIFIMGAAVPISFRSLEKKGFTNAQVLYKIVRRSLILFALGLLVVNNIFDIQQPRIPGVLQRFSISYLVVALVVYFIPERKPQSAGSAVNAAHDEETISPLLAPPRMPYQPIEQSQNPGFIGTILSDFVPWAFQWIIMLSLLFTWLMLTFLVDVPGCGRGYLGPGGIGDWGKYPGCTGGAAGYLDYLVFGTQFVYQTPTCQGVYMTGPYDPEGGLGSLTSIFLCWLGVQLGRIIMNHKGHRSRLARCAVWGVILCVIGGSLCGFEKNGGAIPLNKNMWSLSFILVMGGLGFLVFGFAYIIVDVFKLWNGAPMKYVGMNSIVIYCGHEVFGGYFPLSWNMPIPTHAQVLSSNLIGVICWNSIAYYMFINKFFINI